MLCNDTIQYHNVHFHKIIKSGKYLPIGKSYSNEKVYHMAQNFGELGDFAAFWQLKHW